MATVAVTDHTFTPLDIERAILEPLGAEVTDGAGYPDDLLSVVRDADVVLTQFARIDAKVVDAMGKARAIVRYGIGVDNVDLDAARSRGIPVCNVPDYCIDEVADHTLAFILAVTRQVVPNAIGIRDGRWGLATPLDQMRALRDQTVGIVGFGRIGREVSMRLAPFKCERLVFDAFVPPDAVRSAGCEPVSLDALLARSDIVTLHCPSTVESRKLLNERTIAGMKRGAVVVNLARGDLIDTPALLAALRSGWLGAAAIDVCDPEPIPKDSPLRSLPNVVAASHIASASPRAVRALRESVARIAAAALRGDRLVNVVNGVA
ncbi:MAG: C-terminal binding protein [Planctomycetes bacterium]|nr:C-terminal binding protein [Planctomycetota bacterium]